MGFLFCLIYRFSYSSSFFGASVFFSGNEPQKCLAKFGYNKLNMKVEVLNHLSVFLATYLNHVQKYGFFFGKFG
jgi:hypothetical protein